MANFLSRSGSCKPFDAEADGYSRGEGCAVLVLKPLDDALLDNDRILGIIRGIETNQSYRNTSITRTHPDTQAALLRQLLIKAHVTPDDVDAVEAHAAGTKQGDSAELEALRDVFIKDSPGRGPLYVSSAKAFVGHLEAASGAVSLAKLLLMIRHQVVPRQVGVTSLNSVAASTPLLDIPSTPIPWSHHPDNPRLAVVNNYGAAGSNVSMLVEEFLDQRKSVVGDGVSALVFGMSASNELALHQLRDRYMRWLKASPLLDACVALDVCYTSTARRTRSQYRLAIPVILEPEIALITQLESATIVTVDDTVTSLVFLFPGHGSQYAGMGAGLYSSSRIFREQVDDCESILTSHGYPSILPFILNEGADEECHEEPLVQHTALVSFELALTTLWRAWGVIPAAVIGHRCVLRQYPRYLA